MAARAPGARARRNLLGRGPVRHLEVTAGGERYSGRLRKNGLELAPEADPALWAAGLVAALARAAGRDHEVRRALSRSGWALSVPEARARR